MNAVKLGKFLATLRMEKGLTQDTLAEMLLIDKRKISRWETGNAIPEFDFLIKLSEVFNISLFELSVCKRLPDKKLIEKYKTKLKSYRDYKLLSLRKKVIIILGVIFGIFLGLSAIFFFNNFNATQVYNLDSLDNSFKIKGNYIKTSDYQLFTLCNIEYVGKNKEKLDIDVSKISYDIIQGSKRIIHNIPNNINEKQNLLEFISSLSHVDDSEFIEMNDCEDLVFEIGFSNDDKINDKVSFKFKLVKKFANNYL